MANRVARPRAHCCVRRNAVYHSPSLPCIAPGG